MKKCFAVIEVRSVFFTTKDVSYHTKHSSGLNFPKAPRENTKKENQECLTVLWGFSDLRQTLWTIGFFFILLIEIDLSVWQFDWKTEIAETSLKGINTCATNILACVLHSNLFMSESNWSGHLIWQEERRMSQERTQKELRSVVRHFERCCLIPKIPLQCCHRQCQLSSKPCIKQCISLLCNHCLRRKVLVE